LALIPVRAEGAKPLSLLCFGVYYPLFAEVARDQMRAKRSKPASMHGVRRREDRTTSSFSNRAQSEIPR